MSTKLAQFKQSALDYHRYPKPGKLEISITKPIDTQLDLSLAYSPGVAEPVRAIAENPALVDAYTIKSNLVGIITNGTAVLGLGNVGPLAAKPVMEGKAVLFKRFADIDVFDIEVDALNPQDFIDTVVRISPTFGGINLEDIRGPECFEIEEALIAKLDIPVFHDDQHGTAITIAAGLLNALEIQQKNLSDVKVVCLGAGAAGIASMRLLLTLGVKRDNLFMIDKSGIIQSQRTDLNKYKLALACETDKRTLEEAIEGADVFIGLSGANLLSADLLKTMGANPIVFALSNPDPEIDWQTAHACRQDLIMATGRSDFPNQVNNVLCFPYIFRGALDVSASKINIEMMVAAVEAIRELTKQPVPKEVLEAYGLGLESGLVFGPDYILPKATDFRLMNAVAPKVAMAAIQTGVARAGYPAHYPPTIATKEVAAQGG